MNLYHYTVGTKIPSILNDGYLKLTPKEPLEDETPLVWLSSNEDWEMTANKGAITQDGKTVVLTKEETSLYANGLYRFVFNSNHLSNVLSFNQLISQELMPAPLGVSLVISGVKLGGIPSQWYAVTVPLSIKNVKLQALVDGVWADLEVI